MEKLRKVLVVVFAALCVFFAWEAYLQKRDKSAVDRLAFFAWKTYRAHGGSVRLLEAKEWGARLQSMATKTDRLIFVRIGGSADVSDYAPSHKAEGILARHYICVDMDRDCFPADYGVLRRIAKGDINFAILSSKAYPLLAAKSFGKDPEGPNGDARVFAGAAWAYQKRKAETKSGVRIALLKAGEDRRLPDFPGFFAERRNMSEIFNIRALLESGGWGSSTAVFSENARLAARISAGGDSFARETGKMALEKLLLQLSRGDMDFGERLLLTRALSEFTMLSDSAEARSAFLDLSLEIAGFQRDDGFFKASDKVLLRENALALSVMSRAYRVFKDKKFRNSMRRSVAALQKNTSGRAMLAAVIEDSKGGAPKSEASALDYILLARAYLDAYFADPNGTLLNGYRKTFAQFDELFNDKINDGWYENSKKSIFAPFHYKVLGDAEFPSTVGEALQLLADSSSLGDGIPRRFVKIISALGVMATPESFLDRASVRLSTLANPMRSNSSFGADLAGRGFNQLSMSDASDCEPALHLHLDFACAFALCDCPLAAVAKKAEASLLGGASFFVFTRVSSLRASSRDY